MNPDSADELHRTLDAAPDHQRTGLAALADLPAELAVGVLTGPDGAPERALTAADLEAALRRGDLDSAEVVDLLRSRQALRPGTPWQTT